MEMAAQAQHAVHRNLALVVEVVDLTIEEHVEEVTTTVVQSVQPEQHHQPPQERPHQRRRVTSEDELRYLYVVVHDGEPQDSGSDYEYTRMLHSTQDTKIIGVFRAYQKAKEAAVAYMSSMGFIDYDNDYEEEPMAYNTWFGEKCEAYDWLENGFYREEVCDSTAPNDRIHIQQMELDQPQM